MFISIIIPLYNKEHCITDTINSVLKQSYSNFELVIIDDGSTDKSVEIVSSIIDNRIKLITQLNSGASIARNNGARIASSKYLLFLDADDIILPNALNSIVNLAHKYPNKQVYTGNYITQRKRKSKIACMYLNECEIINPFKEIYHKRWNIRLGSFIVEKELFFEIGGFSTDIIIGEDTYFTNKLIEACNPVYTPLIMMIYKIEHNSLSRKKIRFEKHIENFYTLNSANKYQQLIEKRILFKHIFRGVLSKEPEFSLKLLKKHFVHIPSIILSAFSKITIQNYKNYKKQ